jgi:hypothetical protein
VEIYSTEDVSGRKLSVYKEQVAPGVSAYFVDVSTPSGGQRCALSATSALKLGRALLWSAGRALLWSAHDDAQEPAPETPPPIAPTLHGVD